MKRYFSITLAALAIAACQQPVQPDMAPGKVQVEPVITRATEVNFENGDQIGFTMTKVNGAEAYADNAILTFDGSVFSGDLMWYADAYSEADVYAYYPYEATGTPAYYAAVLDQTAGIAQADFMAAAKKGVLPTPNAITMVFKHMMTKLVINIDNQSGAEVNTVKILGGDAACDIDLPNLAVLPASGGMSTELTEITAYEATAGKVWQAIVIPQTAKLSVEVSLSNGKKITQPLAEMTLKSGGQYTINARLLQDNMIVSASGEIENWTDEGEIGFEGEGTTEELPVEFTEHDGYFVYDGIEYKTVTLADGNTWMAENLRFIPRGRTVSSDPAEDAGIWYPAANAEKVADPALVETLGLLYDAATAFGVESITAENAGTFEGCQGICPTGWHIPTVAEMTGLVGHSSNSALVNTAAPYYDATIKGASIAALAEAGWPWQFASMRNKTSVTGKGSYTVTNYNGIYGIMSYVIGSTLHQATTNEDGSLKNIQYHYFMPLYNSSNEKISVAYGNFLSGASVRCVKNK
ncbi:MAG: fimbrillin family protein [Bacteroidales bacterium]|nr:fimbrillin family protein [Bacteroidales bacterium]